jgi:cytochrome c-type biogenesis protein CcmH
MSLMLPFALMTAAAMLAALWPLLRKAADLRSGSDVAVYRDQLDEVARDLTAGYIGKTEAEAARVEVSRRLLAAAAVEPTTAAPENVTATAWRRRGAAVAALLALPGLAAGLYLWLGSPQLASAQLAAAHAPVAADASTEALIAQAEAYLQRNPNDGRAWEVVAPVYMQLGRYADSVTAWNNALQLNGESADRRANLGEALTAESGGVVTAEAKAAFARAVALDDTTVSARFYLGLAAEQDGKRDQAAAIWRKLIAEAPAGAPWVDTVRGALARVETGAAPPSVANAAAAPSPADKPSGPQAAMIQAMVAGLAARLHQDGADVDGWVRLVRSYKVLGEADKERAAIADARQALAGDADKSAKLEASLKALDTGDAATPDAAPAAPGAAAADGPGLHQGAAVEDMVERLARRLKSSGADPEGWLMLVRSYTTLGRKDQAKAAVDDARRALAGTPDRLEQFNQALAKIDGGSLRQ